MNPGLLINIGARTAMMTRSLRNVSTEMAFVARNAGRMGDAMKKGTSAARLVGDSVHIATGVMKALGTATLATAGAFSAFATVTSKAFMGFESEMLRVEAVTGATQRQVDTLTGSIGKLSRATGISQAKLAEGAGFLGMAGFKPDVINQALPAVTQLSTIGQMDFASSADIVTNVMTGMGIGVNDLQKAVDALVNTMTGANVDLRMLGDGFKYVGPYAKAMGISLEQTAAAMGLLGNAGVQGEMGGTALRNVLMRLQAPTSNTTKLLKAYGLELYNANGSVKDFITIVKELERVDIGRTALTQIFGARGMAGIMPLLEQGSSALEKFTQSNMNARSAATLFEKILSSYEAQANKAKATLDALAITAGGQFKVAFVEMMKAVNMNEQSFSSWNQTVRDMTQESIVGVIKFVAESIRVFQDMRTVVSVVGDTFKGVALIIKAVFVGAVHIISKSLNAIDEMFTSMFKGIAESLNAWYDKVDGVLPYATKHMRPVVEFFNDAAKNTFKFGEAAAETKKELIALDSEYSKLFGNTAANKELAESQKKWNQRATDLDNFASSVSQSFQNMNAEDAFKKEMEALQEVAKMGGASAAQAWVMAYANLKGRFSSQAQAMHEDLARGVAKPISAYFDDMIPPDVPNQLRDLMLAELEVASATAKWTGENDINIASLKKQKGASEALAKAMGAASKKVYKAAVAAQKAADKEALKRAQDFTDGFMKEVERLHRLRIQAEEAAARHIARIQKLQEGNTRDWLNRMFEGFKSGLTSDPLREQVDSMNQALQAQSMSAEELKTQAAMRHNEVLERQIQHLQSLTSATQGVAVGYFDMQSSVAGARTAQEALIIKQNESMKLLTALPAIASRAAGAFGAGARAQVIAQIAVNSALAAFALAQGFLGNPAGFSAAAVLGLNAAGGIISLIFGGKGKATFQPPDTASTGSSASSQGAVIQKSIEEALKAAGLWQNEARDQSLFYGSGDPLEHRERSTRSAAAHVDISHRARRVRF